MKAQPERNDEEERVPGRLWGGGLARNQPLWMQGRTLGDGDDVLWWENYLHAVIVHLIEELEGLNFRTINKENQTIVCGNDRAPLKMQAFRLL